jgi:hypothetical protein
MEEGGHNWGGGWGSSEDEAEGGKYPNLTLTKKS